MSHIVTIPPLPALHSAFLAILPRIELHGRVYFRHVRCGELKQEMIQEMVALSWQWFLTLARRGKDATAFPSALASFAARAVRSGRRLAGHERTRDVLSPVAQARHGFVTQSLPACDAGAGNEALEALRDNTRTPPPEQVAFRLDFPRWRRTRSRRDRRLIDRMMAGERTLDLASTFRVSPARVSQLRREFHADWERFCGELDGQEASCRS